jgi:hypothetical protein
MRIRPHTEAEGRLRMASCDGVGTPGGLNRHLSRYSNLNSRFADSPEMWNCGQTRYAPTHLPSHVGRAIKSTLKSPPTVPSRSSKPFPPTPMASTSLPCGQVNEGRSFPATGLSSGLQPDGANTRAHEKVRSWGHESNLPGNGLWVRSPRDAWEGSWASDDLGLIFCVWESASLDEARD